VKNTTIPFPFFTSVPLREQSNDIQIDEAPFLAKIEGSFAR
jgi:hypothetical protein